VILVDVNNDNITDLITANLDGNDVTVPGKGKWDVGTLSGMIVGLSEFLELDVYDESEPQQRQATADAMQLALQ